MCSKSLADRKQYAWMESQLAILATDKGTTFAKLFQVEGIQTILFELWAFRVYTLHNLTPIRLFCVKGRFSGLSGKKRPCLARNPVVRVQRVNFWFSPLFANSRSHANLRPCF